jgi:hypothetical protein
VPCGRVDGHLPVEAGHPFPQADQTESRAGRRISGQTAAVVTDLEANEIDAAVVEDQRCGRCPSVFTDVGQPFLGCPQQ